MQLLREDFQHYSYSPGGGRVNDFTDIFNTTFVELWSVNRGRSVSGNETMNILRFNILELFKSKFNQILNKN
jgi:hypothetical protein